MYSRLNPANQSVSQNLNVIFQYFLLSATDVDRSTIIRIQHNYDGGALPSLDLQFVRHNSCSKRGTTVVRLSYSVPIEQRMWSATCSMHR
jgi:hypothetical protein